MEEKQNIPMGGKRLGKDESAPHRKRWWIAAICAAGALILAFGAMCVLAGQSTTVLRGVSALDVTLGGLSQEQAAAQLEQEVVRATQRAGAEFRIDEQKGVYRSYEELGLRLDCEKTAARAYDCGRGGNALVNGWQFLSGLLGGKTPVEPVWTVDAPVLRDACTEIAGALSYEPTDFSCVVDGDGLLVTRARDGRSVTAETVMELCRTKVCAGGALLQEFTLDSELLPAQQGDLAALQKEYADACVNARYDAEADEILPEKTHAAFDLAQAQQLLSAAAPGGTVLIPAQVEQPTVTAEALRAVLFRDVLSEYTTKVGGAPGRHENVRVTAEKITGSVMNAGESFRYSEHVMPFTEANGYFLAPMYLKGKTVDGWGGGACQASSTLYAATLYADLEIVRRMNHGFASDYIGLGLDATVAQGGPEFEVRNNTDYPIKIVAEFKTIKSKDYITVKLLGTKTDDHYVKIRTEVLSTTPFEEEIVETDELAPGVRVVEQTPYTGYLVKTYRSVYAGDGTLLSTGLEATSKYNARNRIVKVGRSADAAGIGQPADAPVDGPVDDVPASDESTMPEWLDF